ncbi:MAG: hypothetical protein QXQ61_04390 [Candidatus Bathyarchaeia archaeon]
MERLAYKETVEELARQWKKMWRERVDDKLKAEGIANSTYPMLSVDKGTVIFATRNFRMMSFREILELHGIGDAEKFVAPNPQIGGWGKFIRTMVLNQKPSSRVKRATLYLEKEKEKQQLKKSGRGWLHR